MTFQEAIANLNCGSRIKLPEWKGWWAPAKDEETGDTIIEVHTFDEKVLPTPHTKYMLRNDWQALDTYEGASATDSQTLTRR